jgi:flagellar basal-body rod protein FlgB
MRIFGPMIEGIGQALDLYQARHRVLAENVANAETPGYRARDLDFGSALARAFEPTEEPRTAEGAEPTVDAGATLKIDGNSVDLDTEMARLSENAFKIVALSQILARRYANLRAVITEGRS